MQGAVASGRGGAGAGGARWRRAEPAAGARRLCGVRRERARRCWRRWRRRAVAWFASAGGERSRCATGGTARTVADAGFGGSRGRADGRGDRGGRCAPRSVTRRALRSGARLSGRAAARAPARRRGARGADRAARGARRGRGQDGRRGGAGARARPSGSGGRWRRGWDALDVVPGERGDDRRRGRAPGASMRASLEAMVVTLDLVPVVAAAAAARGERRAGAGARRMRPRDGRCSHAFETAAARRWRAAPRRG